MDKLIVFALTTLPAAAAFATYCKGDSCNPPPVSVPEPGMFGLMATAGIVFYLVNRFKKRP
ncbi:PEP-CTERM sorting domain-containing protein [Marinobacter sp. R17]|uniref:PEP-CTERM sorting domain-containing protein n=1 Tax=Marinobacter sp. R17 TaxID=2484250 RepID=UPI0016802DB9|nr:PEP-CTERM sorting domain-containing protein [Marinobacter sp. R17]